MSSDDKKTTVRARRRRPKTTKPAERERAKAPRRRRQDSGADQRPPQKPPSRPRPSTTSTRPPRPGGGLPQMPGRLPKIPLSLILILGAIFVCIIVAFILFSSGGFGGSGDDISFDIPTQVIDSSQPLVPPTATPRPFTPPAATTGEQTWLVMLYQDADDQVLERDIYIDLNEAERVGSSDRLHIVAQVDRFSRGYQGDGDWSSAKRFYVTQDPDLEVVRSQQMADLGEVNMADGDTLVDFVTWAIDTFPADKHVLILSDHGMGWPGGWTDPEPGGRGDHNVALAEKGDELFLMEIDESLVEIRARTGLDKFELIGMDACLMGHVEVFSALAPHGRYAVASQETEPALGWAYAAFLQALKDNPDMTGADLGRLIVQSYIREDQRIVDAAERARFIGQGAGLGGIFGLLSPPSAEQVARQMETDMTLTAADLGAMPALNASLNDLAYALSGVSQQTVASARTYAQSFTSVFGKNVPPSYIDLGNFAQLASKQTGSSEVARASDQLMAALDQFVVAEKHGPRKPGATGVSIYFPNSQLYGTRYTGPDSYTTIANRFAAESLWDDYLVYHYTGRPFEPAAGEIALPSRGATITGPGAEELQVAPVTVSSDVVAPGEAVLLSTEIQGQNIGHVFLFVGYHDRQANSIYVADTDYLDSGVNQEIGGVYYPYWGEDGTLVLEFEWEPIVYAVSDGDGSALALFEPRDFGASPEQAVYTVEGIYSFSDGSAPRHARMYFSDGVLKQVYVYTNEQSNGAPREILPQPGDSFTVLQKWMDLGAEGAIQYVTQEGETVYFGAEPFTWEELWAPAGDYVVGFIVQDLDGNGYKTYTSVTVAE